MRQIQKGILGGVSGISVESSVQLLKKSYRLKTRNNFGK
jgi:hypothetical protein